jgi:4-alpha-glucanotransferase
MQYLGVTRQADVPWAMIRLCWASVCDTAITQMQDLLGLDNKARMNTPSTLGGNWTWRLDSMDKLDTVLAERLYKLGKTYGRINKK